MSGHTAEERIDAIAREITNEIRCEERARERIAEALLEGDVYLLKILLDVIDNKNAALKEQHPIVNSHADLVRALEPFAKIADDYDRAHEERVRHYADEGRDFGPPQPDYYLVSVSMGDCRKARAALATLTARKVG